MKKFNNSVGELGEKYWNAFLRRTENMTYEECENELPYLIGVFCETYPERCPPKIEEKVIRVVQPQLHQLPQRKGNKRFDKNQLLLFFGEEI